MRLGMTSNVRRAAVLAIAVDLILCMGLGRAGETPTAEEIPTPAEQKPVSDTGRFYFYFETGHAGILNSHVAGDAHLDTPDGINVVLGGGGGYNITDYWGVEIQGHGTEPEVRSSTYGKIKEFSNITIVGAARFRYPLGEDRRLVPYLTAGVGASLNEVNDSGNPRIKIDAERTTLVGALALGLEYFAADDVAVGISMHTFIYPNASSSMVVRDPRNRIIVDDDSDVNLTAISALAHLRVFPGQSGSSGDRRLLFADHGPFDTDELRGYLYLMGGNTWIFDDKLVDDVSLAAPGDFNATLGGGLGVNLSKHWGAEIQLLNSEPNVNLSGIGKFAELSNFTVLPMVRFRWPFCGGRLVPFAAAGLGVAFNDVNDARHEIDQFDVNGAVRAPTVDVDGTSIAGSIQFGAEYFLNHHVSFGVTVPVYLYPDWDTSVRYHTTQRPGGGSYPRGVVRGSTNFSSIGTLLAIKVYLP
jgi:opacity protein-like surface antigen